MKKITFVLPCLNEEKNLALLLPEIIKNVPKKYLYEIICVDDGSTDNTFGILSGYAKKNKRVKIISFYRRSGHQAALRVGIEKASGDAVVTLDADFQHPPKFIPKLISFWEKGYDLVQAQKRDDRTASIQTKLQRKVGYFIWSKISEDTLIPGVSDFRLIDKSIANYIKQAHESEIFLRGLSNLGSNKPKTITYSVGKRKFGKSSYTTGMFVNMFINGFISFSPKPLRIASVFGIILAAVTGLFIVYDTANAVFSRVRIIEGWVTVVFLLIMLNGFIIFYLGLLGEYMGVIFREVKKRPGYMIDRTINL